MVNLNHAIISYFLKILEKALAGRVFSTNFDAWCYIVWYCTTQVYRLLSGIRITEPSDEYLLKLHFVVGRSPKLVKLYRKILFDAVNLCLHNCKFPTMPISFLLFYARFQIHIKYNVNFVSITQKILLENGPQVLRQILISFQFQFLYGSLRQ